MGAGKQPDTLEFFRFSPKAITHFVASPDGGAPLLALFEGRRGLPDGSARTLS